MPFKLRLYWITFKLRPLQHSNTKLRFDKFGLISITNNVKCESKNLKYFHSNTQNFQELISYRVLLNERNNNLGLSNDIFELENVKNNDMSLSTLNDDFVCWAPCSFTIYHLSEFLIMRQISCLSSFKSKFQGFLESLRFFFNLLLHQVKS